ncbi:hypothetical protein OHT52_14560 [Streptomyces sp. NBC_00247]|uniref:hypothetical protein n=1 Tax=Streptomyces sp. NBC_00247 TaxID=2975689 RepID=UPI002E2940F8|nr:hypothetical protein [Streptomyces sp. NBC_00247]
MTSTTGTTEHPDVSEIADLGEGLLSLPRAAEVRRHLLSCVLCEDVRSSLEEIESLLGSMPLPAPMPSDVAARIDAALAAEMRTHDRVAVGASSEDLDVSRETSSGETAVQTTEQPAARITDAHPAVQRQRKGPSVSRSTTRPSPDFTRPGRRSSVSRRRIVLGAAFGAGILGVGTLLFQTADALPDRAFSSDASSKAAGPTSQTAAASEAGEFTAARLPEQVRDLLDSAPTLRHTEKPDSSAQEAHPSATPLVGDPLSAPYVPACVQRALGRTDAVLGAESGEYEGTETYLVVLSHPTDSTLVTAYLVDARCTASDPSGTGSLMFSHSYPRS